MEPYELIGVSIIVVAFAFIMGIILQGIQRKLVARFQNRIGPPVLQPLYDILKLLNKETMVPRNAVRFVFILAPFISLAAMVTAVLLVPIAAFTYWNFSGDVIVLLYVVVLASIGVVIGASSSGSPFSAV
ncbi:MAG: NADH-quinone oxidoreductase subunit H, partial [Candidatus Micrarchaeota archaeon]